MTPGSFMVNAKTSKSTKSKETTKKDKEKSKDSVTPAQKAEAAQTEPTYERIKINMPTNLKDVNGGRIELQIPNLSLTMDELKDLSQNGFEGESFQAMITQYIDTTGGIVSIKNQTVEFMSEEDAGNFENLVYSDNHVTVEAIQAKSDSKKQALGQQGVDDKDPSSMPQSDTQQINAYSVAEYNPQNAMGMRTERHVFRSIVEVNSRYLLPHLEECYIRRVSIQRLQHEKIVPYSPMSAKMNRMFMHQDKGRNTFLSQNGISMVHLEGRFYIWHQYYQRRWDGFDTGEKSIATAQTSNWSKDISTFENMPKSTIKNDLEETSEADLGTQRIRTSWVKMGLQTQVDQLDYDLKVLRESDLINHAFGWERSVELPIDALQRNENQQIVEYMISLVAILHETDWVKRLDAIFDGRLQEIENKSKYFFTIDPDGNQDHLVTREGGIVEKVTAKNINTLKTGSYGQKFFSTHIEIQPSAIVYNILEQLVVEKQEVVFKNTAKEVAITINDIFSNSPEIVVFESNLPASLEPGESLKITILIVPETTDLIQAAIFVCFNKRYVYLIPVTAFVVENQYGLKPIYYTDVNIGQQIESKIEINNQEGSDISITEAYTTEEFTKLHWPNDMPFNEEDMNQDFSKYLTIPAKSKSTVFKVKFMADQNVDHSGMVHLQTNQGSVLRVPIYYHVFRDPIKFLPSIVDLGIVPINFDVIRVPIKLRIREGSGFDLLYLEEVLLPLNDERLDFVMGEWDRNPYGNIQIFNKELDRLEEHRRGVILANKEFELMTLLMKPSKWGLIDTRIILTFKCEDGSSFEIRLPIIGSVTPSNSIILSEKNSANLQQLVPTQYQEFNKFYPFLPPDPAIVVNVADLVQQNQRVSSKSQSLLKEKMVIEPLILKGNYNVTFRDVKILNTQSNIPFQFYRDTLSDLKYGTTMQMGQFNTNTKDLITSHGRKYFWIQSNNVLIPQYIQITDQKLICSIEEDFMPTRYQDCESGISLNFGKVGQYQPKQRVMNITNIGHETVLLDWVNKTVINDELSVLYEDHLDELRQAFPELQPRFLLEDSDNILIDRFISRQRVGIYLLPGKSITLKFQLEGAYNSLNGGKSTEVMTHKAFFSFMPATYAMFSVNYTYQIVSGNLQVTSNNIEFDPGFIGKWQKQNLSIKSFFNIPVLIQSIKSTDTRLLPIIKQSVIEPQMDQVVIEIQFDPSTSLIMESFSLAIKQKGGEHAAEIWQRSNNLSSQGYVQNSKSSVHQNAARFNDSSIANFTTVIAETLINLNEHDIALWRNFNSQFETKGLTNDKDQLEIIEEIEANITIKTNIVDEIQVPVKAKVTKPNIINESMIDFGVVQLGDYKRSSINLHNPFNQTLYLSLFIGRNTELINNEIEKMGVFNQDQRMMLMEKNKGTRFEKHLLEDIFYRMTEPSQKDKFQERLYQLPDMQRFCKNLRADTAESHAAQFKISRDESLEKNEPLQTKEVDKSSDKSQQQRMIRSHEPFDIKIRTGEDMQFCDVLQGLIALMNDDFALTNTWQAINDYYKMRHEEILETTAQANLSRMQLIQNQLLTQQNNAAKNVSTDSKSYIDPVTAKIQNKFQSLHPDALKMPVEVDFDIMKDIHKCTESIPFSLENVYDNLYINSYLAFPNPFQFGWLGTIRKAFTLDTYISPIRRIGQWYSDLMKEESWKDSFVKMFTQFGNTFIYYVDFNSRSGYKISNYLSKAYLDKNAKDLPQPAPALSRQWELTNSKLHDQILINNSTVGVNLYSQNFFLNPNYLKATIKIEPGEFLKLDDALIFEPRSFSSQIDEMQMTLYIKSDKSVLQAVPLRGKASSSFLDISHVTKRFEEQGVEIEHTQKMNNYTVKCVEQFSNLKIESTREIQQINKMKCFMNLESQFFVREQIVGKSTMPQELKLYITKGDIQTVEEKFDYSLSDQSFLMRNVHRVTSNVFLPLIQRQQSFTVRPITWDIDILNVGDLPLTVEQIYLEDPNSGQIVSDSDSIKLKSPRMLRFEPHQTRTVTLEYQDNKQIFAMKKNLILKSSKVIQRFPIKIETDSEAIIKVYPHISPEYLNEFTLFKFLNSCISALIIGTMLVIMFAWAFPLSFKYYLSFDVPLNFNTNMKLFARNLSELQEEQKQSNKSVEKIKDFVEDLTPDSVITSYQNTQQKVKNSETIFLRECTNIASRKLPKKSNQKANKNLKKSNQIVGKKIKTINNLSKDFNNIMQQVPSASSVVLGPENLVSQILTQDIPSLTMTSDSTQLTNKPLKPTDQKADTQSSSKLTSEPSKVKEHSTTPSTAKQVTMKEKESKPSAIAQVSDERVSSKSGEANSATSKTAAKQQDSVKQSERQDSQPKLISTSVKREEMSSLAQTIKGEEEIKGQDMQGSNGAGNEQMEEPNKSKKPDPVNYQVPSNSQSQEAPTTVKAPKSRLTKKERKALEARRAKNQELEEQSRVELARKAIVAKQQRQEEERKRKLLEQQEAERKERLEQEQKILQEKIDARQRQQEIERIEQERIMEEVRLKQEENHRIKEAKKAQKEAQQAELKLKIEHEKKKSEDVQDQKSQEAKIPQPQEIINLSHSSDNVPNEDKAGDKEDGETALSWGISARETVESQHETISDGNQSQESYPKNQQNSAIETRKQSKRQQLRNSASIEFNSNQDEQKISKAGTRTVNRISQDQYSTGPNHRNASVGSIPFSRRFAPSTPVKQYVVKKQPKPNDTKNQSDKSDERSKESDKNEYLSIPSEKEEEDSKYHPHGSGRKKQYRLKQQPQQQSEDEYQDAAYYHRERYDRNGKHFNGQNYNSAGGYKQSLKREAGGAYEGRNATNDYDTAGGYSARNEKHIKGSANEREYYAPKVDYSRHEVIYDERGKRQHYGPGYRLPENAVGRPARYGEEQGAVYKRKKVPEDATWVPKRGGRDRQRPNHRGYDEYDYDNEDYEQSYGEAEYDEEYDDEIASEREVSYHTATGYKAERRQGKDERYQKMSQNSYAYYQNFNRNNYAESHYGQGERGGEMSSYQEKYYGNGRGFREDFYHGKRGEYFMEGQSAAAQQQYMQQHGYRGGPQNVSRGKNYPPEDTRLVYREKNPRDLPPGGAEYDERFYNTRGGRGPAASYQNQEYQMRNPRDKQFNAPAHAPIGAQYQQYSNYDRQRYQGGKPPYVNEREQRYYQDSQNAPYYKQGERPPYEKHANPRSQLPPAQQRSKEKLVFVEKRGQKEKCEQEQYWKRGSHMSQKPRLASMKMDKVSDREDDEEHKDEQDYIDPQDDAQNNDEGKDVEDDDQYEDFQDAMDKDDDQCSGNQEDQESLQEDTGNHDDDDEGDQEPYTEAGTGKMDYKKFLKNRQQKNSAMETLGADRDYLNDEYDCEDDDPLRDTIILPQNFSRKVSGMSSDNEMMDASPPRQQQNEQKQQNLFSNFKKIKQIFSQVQQPTHNDNQMGSGLGMQGGSSNSLFGNNSYGGLFGEPFGTNQNPFKSDSVPQMHTLFQGDDQFFKQQQPPQYENLKPQRWPNEDREVIYGSEKPKPDDDQLMASHQEFECNQTTFERSLQPMVPNNPGHSRQPNSLEALRMTSRPLNPRQAPQQESVFGQPLFPQNGQPCGDQSSTGFNLQWQNLGPYKGGFATQQLDKIKDEDEERKVMLSDDLDRDDFDNR